MEIAWAFGLDARRIADLTASKNGSDAEAFLGVHLGASFQMPRMEGEHVVQLGARHLHTTVSTRQFHHIMQSTSRFRRGMICVGVFAFLGSFGLPMCQAQKPGSTNSGATKSLPAGATNKIEEKKLEKATFGGGCFWCTEAVFQRVKGVKSVVSGYTGGTVENPTYQQVCTGETGHAEVIQVEFDPEQVSYAKLLEIHWKTHDPTTLNRQGYDEGTQYRSAIFYENEEQRKTAEEYKEKLNKEVFDGKITTEITALTKFYPAEDYHQNYFNLNSKKGYCQAIIVPKLKKFEEIFKDVKKP